MPKTGDKPGNGLYKCKKCGETFRLGEHSDRLPPCPKCETTEFIQVSQ